MTSIEPKLEGTTSRKSLESVERVVRVLRMLESPEPVTLAEVARRSELSEATALRYLSSLCIHGLAERTDAGRYRLGWELFRLSRGALEIRVPRDLALPVMERLREQFNETVNLAMRERDDLVLVEVLQSRRTLKQVNEVGHRDPWHASGLGKVMLAFMPEAERDALLSRVGIRPLTPRTIVSRRRLDEQLDEVRRRGYAIDVREVDEDWSCVASVVLGPNDTPSFSLSVSFPSFRVGEQDLHRAGDDLVAAATELRRRLGYER